MNAPVNVVASSQCPPTISPGGTGGCEVNVDANAGLRIRQGLDVALRADEFEVFVHSAPLELRRAVIVAAQVSQLQLAQAAYAGCDGGFSDAVFEREPLQPCDK